MICSKCVTPHQLKKLIEEQGEENYCQYCQTTGVAVGSQFLFDHILELVDENLATEEDLTHLELGLIHECGSSMIDCGQINTALFDWFDLGDELYFDDLIKYLPDTYRKDDRGNERYFYRDYGNLEKNQYEQEWENFTQQLKHSNRFFNQNANKFLDSIFSVFKTENHELKPEVIHKIKRGEEIFRARNISNYEDAEKITENPYSELGLAPKDKTSNQRMTPNGISALYCALERDTCLSEIRCITGDLVISGAFTPCSELHFLDLTKLENIVPPKLGLFEHRYRDNLNLKTFLNSLVNKLSKPKTRNDELSYLSTQIVFEYLRINFGNLVDGLITPSVQTGKIGTNIILFPEACIISTEKFNSIDVLESVAESSHLEDPFYIQEKLMFVENSLRYHCVTAIETKAEQYDTAYELFMPDLTRKQLDLPTRK